VVRVDVGPAIAAGAGQGAGGAEEDIEQVGRAAVGQATGALRGGAVAAGGDQLLISADLGVGLLEGGELVADGALAGADDQVLAGLRRGLQHVLGRARGGAGDGHRKEGSGSQKVTGLHGDLQNGEIKKTLQ
jgi:hypothetical protein